MLIADVSGKGTSAALYMAELKGLVLSLSRNHSSPRDLLIDGRTGSSPSTSNSRSFITMTYAVVDLRARTMTYARAGHTPLICLPGTERAEPRTAILAPDGMVLGLKIDNGEMFERLLEEADDADPRGRHLSVLHRRHQRGDERGATTASAKSGSGSSSRSTPTCRRTSCASACCARSRRSSATRRSTTT